MKKMNCWEFHKCKQGNMDKCPAYFYEKNDGVNSGKRSGRYCWKVVKEFEIQKSCGIRFYAGLQNLKCQSCEFFKKVMKEEGDEFQL